MCLSSTAMAHAAFVPTGMVTVMLGPLLPLLAARWSLNDAQAGYLITAQFLGSLLGTFASGLLLPRLGFRSSVAVGQILMALGVAGLISAGFGLGGAAIFCYGVGIGITIPAGNLMVAEIEPRRRSANLNLLNFSWSAGAIACPLALSLLQKMDGTKLFLRGIAGLLLVLTMILLLSPGELRRPARTPPASRGNLRSLRTAAAIQIGILFFVYVGTENALGGWLASYAKRINDSPAGVWMLVSSYFYGALLLGRALAPVAARRLSDIAQACGGVVLGLAGSLVLLVSRSASAIAVCAFLAGLGLSTLYPIAISLLASTFGAEARSIGGCMFALSTLGGASLPWLVGFLSTELGSLRAGLLVPFVGCLVMLVIFTRARWRLVPA